MDYYAIHLFYKWLHWILTSSKAKLILLIANIGLPLVCFEFATDLKYEAKSRRPVFDQTDPLLEIGHNWLQRLDAYNYCRLQLLIYFTQLLIYSWPHVFRKWWDGLKRQLTSRVGHGVVRAAARGLSLDRGFSLLMQKYSKIYCQHT